MEMDLVDFYNILAVRNQLSTMDRSQLQEMYQDMNAYYTFLDTIGTLINNDSGFLLLDDEIPNKVLTILGIHRFEKDLPNEVKEYINDVITAINEMNAFPEKMKDVILGTYAVYHAETREKVFSTNAQLLASLAMDSLMYVSLTQGRLELITNDDYALASLNYLMKTIPIIFADKEINQRAQKIIDDIDKKTATLSIKKVKVKRSKKICESINGTNMI